MIDNLPPPLPDLIRRPHDVVRLALGWLMLAVICLSWGAVAVLLQPLARTDFGRNLGRQVAMRGFRLYLGGLTLLGIFRFDLKEIDQLRDAGPLILIANHPGLLDALMLISRLPNVACIMKASLLRNPLFGAAAQLACYIPNHAPLAIVLAACKELQRGGQVLLFPEGSRTRRPPLNPFVPTAALIARRAGVPVQTLVIETNSAYLSKDWPITRIPRVPIHFRVRLGERFAPDADTRGLTARLEQHIAAALSPQAAPTRAQQHETV